MNGKWGGGTDDNPRSHRYGERDWVASRAPNDDQAVRRVLWQRVLQRPWRTLFQDEYFAWSTTGVRNPRASTAILGLFLFAFVALVVPLFLVFLAFASQVFVLTMVLSVPLILMGVASLFGVAGLLCAGGLALTAAVMTPMLALSSAGQGLLWPALGMASIGSIWWVNRQRQTRLDRVMEMRSEDSTQASASAEPSPDEAYLQRAREDLAQFDARLFGSSSPEAPTRTRETFQNPFRFGLGSEPPMNIWGVRRDQVERWNEQEVARAAQSFGLPSRICRWLARELVDGRVVLALTDAEQQELVSSVQPRLTFGERKLLRDFLRYLSRSI
ncbi:hypothetical protein CCYA_CCYA04G1414 [Cyanidiococcus yangmingshanensis]|nr:hypothetical protein CCYA_CCYA04G1414 [Cyanidiococcus yangmingshanensis]